MDSTASALNAIRDGRIKALAVTTARHAPPPLDTIPTIAETVPGYASAGWSGLAAPAQVPDEIVDRINADVTALLRDPAIVKPDRGTRQRPRSDDAHGIRGIHRQGHGDLGGGGEGYGDEAGVRSEGSIEPSGSHSSAAAARTGRRAPASA